MNQGIMQAPKELTARNIFDRIVKGQTVRLPNDPVLVDQLKNHLNVIKSREKKLFESLGLDFLSSVISVTKLHGSDISTGPFECYEIKLKAPKKRRTYSVFSIQETDVEGEPVTS